ncbi:hypothetical protein RJ641_007193 [Dillenia turbinata]|uniref:DEUBAD domain-containing protein n=1 Tax=Dillenia turbinata TaxID=194707 RepID=A0AAN8VJN0_9MAGN
MVADQRRKRMNATSIFCTSREQYKAKQKNHRLPQHDLNLRFHISLEWDDGRKRVVAKRDQIGIGWRDLSPFIPSIPHHDNTLADVFTISPEIFRLENLSEVLSFEVWQNHLSENERNLLAQYLPRGVEARQVVQSLLSGDNFHFGNPFLKWQIRGGQLCSGDLHPDAVIQHEKLFKSNKRAYYSELQSYHTDIIRNLQRWKEQWEMCEDPETEILQMMWRSKNGRNVQASSPANEHTYFNQQDNLAATSDSSGAADERACSSDNQNSMKGRLQPKRINDRGLGKSKYESASMVADVKVVQKPQKEEKLLKHNSYGDGAKYMSYFKISKKQHQLVKSLKQSGSSILSKSLNCVLGNLNSFHVQPYEVFEKEERMKLHEHWLQLTNKEIPEAFSNWKSKHLQRRKLIESLGEELKQNLNDGMKYEFFDMAFSLVAQNDGKESSDEVLVDLKDNDAIDHQLTIEDDDSSDPASEQNEGIDNETNPEASDDSVPAFAQNGVIDQEATMEDNEDSVHDVAQDLHLPQIPLLNGSHEFNPINLGSETNHPMSEPDGVAPNASEYLGNINSTETAVCQEVPLLSPGDAWPAVRMADAYYDHTALNNEYASSGDLSLRQSKIVEERPAQLLDLESNVREENVEKDLFDRQRSNESFFGSYPMQDQNELLQHLYRGQGMPPYAHKQKQMGLEFHPANNVLMESVQFPAHIREQLQPMLPLDLGQKRQNELFINQNVQDNIFPDRDGYLIPRQGQFPTVNMQDWSVDPIHLSAPVHPYLNGDLISQNWFSGNQQIRGGWSPLGGSGVPIPSSGARSNVDGSLFSVLSQCKELQSATSMGSDLVGTSRSFGDADASVSRGNNVMPQVGQSLNYFGGHETTALKPDNMVWMNVSNQSSALQDSMGKPLLRPWNQ